MLGEDPLKKDECRLAEEGKGEGKGREKWSNASAAPGPIFLPCWAGRQPVPLWALCRPRRGRVSPLMSHPFPRFCCTRCTAPCAGVLHPFSPTLC